MRGRGLPWRLIVLVVGVSCMLYCLVGFFWKDISWAISANVLVWKLPVLLFTMGMIRTMIFFLVVSHYGLFEWFAYVVYVGDGV